MEAKFHERFILWALVIATITVAIGTIFGAITALFNTGFIEALKVIGQGIIGMFGVGGLAHLYYEHLKKSS